MLAPMSDRILSIQSAMRDLGIDHWLFYGFHDVDPLAVRVLELPGPHHFSRRWFCLVPARGEPIRLVHKIEAFVLDAVPGRKLQYAGWKELHQQLGVLLDGVSKVAMQYSPMNAIPYVSRVDAGTIELVRSYGTEVVTSADLVALFEASWTPWQLATHVEATDNLYRIVGETFAEVRRCIEKDVATTEYDVQQFIYGRYGHYGMVSDSEPIASVNANAGNPHYAPSRDVHQPVRRGDLLLIDLWARKDHPDAVYGDITWTGFLGAEVPPRIAEVFSVVAGGRDAAVAYLRDCRAKGQLPMGWQVDDVTRDYIAARGFGDYFIHRTGHSIAREVHSNGANIDNFETQDQRRILPRTGFSIEPGVYLPEFGIRSEIDVYVDEKSVQVHPPVLQTEVVPILAASGPQP